MLHTVLTSVNCILKMRMLANRVEGVVFEENVFYIDGDIVLGLGQNEARQDLRVASNFIRSSFSWQSAPKISIY